MALLQNGDHCDKVRSCLAEMLTNDHYWNIIVFCSDGALAHNRMIIGLIFPELTDEITVICPDYTVQDLTDSISKILDINEASSEVDMERMVVSHVVDTDTHVFTPGDMDNICHEDENITNGEDPLQMDVDEAPEIGNARINTDTDTDPYQLSSDSKLELKPHLEALRQKSLEKPVRISSFKTSPENRVRKSPFKRIKLKRKRNVSQGCNKSKQEDEQVVKNLMDDIIEKIHENENHPSNLVFSTLGLSNVNPTSPESHVDYYHENDDAPYDHNIDDDNDDDISAYLNSSREASPDIDTEIVDNIQSDSESSSVGAKSVDSESSSLSCSVAKIRKVKVDVERLRVDDDDRDVMRSYIDRRRENHIMRKRENKNVEKRDNVCRKSNRKRDLKERNMKHNNSKKRLMSAPKLRKSKRCFECETCKIPDCRKCLFCKDMKKYGGKGVKKQSCMMRPKCLVLLNNPGKKINKTVKPPAPVAQPEVKKVETTMIKKSKNHNMINVQINSDKKQEPINNERAKLQKFKSLNSDNVIIRQNKIKEIKKKFKEQEEKAMSGKVDMTNLSREELLFGFYL